MEALEYSLDGGRAYFAMETEKALGAVSQALSGVPLRQIARRIKLFAQALCGRDLRIYDLPDSLESGQPMVRATVNGGWAEYWIALDCSDVTRHSMKMFGCIW